MILTENTCIALCVALAAIFYAANRATALLWHTRLVLVWKWSLKMSGFVQNAPKILHLIKIRLTTNVRNYRWKQIISTSQVKLSWKLLTNWDLHQSISDNYQVSLDCSNDNKLVNRNFMKPSKQIHNPSSIIKENGCTVELGTSLMKEKRKTTMLLVY